jgi:hypothetical protein
LFCSAAGSLLLAAGGTCVVLILFLSVRKLLQLPIV